MTRSALALVAATLAVVLLAAPALAQPEAEFAIDGGYHQAIVGLGGVLRGREVELEIGGGYHHAFDLPEFLELPSTVAVDARVTRWSGRWGVAARALIGLGGVVHRGQGAYEFERRRPTYFHVLVRHRSVGPGGTGLHLGVGGGVAVFEENGRVDSHAHVLAAEALGSKSLTDRLSIRFGVTMVVPIQVTPTVLLAWGF